MGSRIRENPDKIFDLFAEVAKPTSDGEPFILQMYPEDYDEEDVVKSLPKFAFPCEVDSHAVDHFTFVLTDIESKYKFGFCRHTAGAQTCLCIISALPWYEIFYKLLNYLAEILNKTDNNNVVPLLTALHKHEISSIGTPIDIISPGFKEEFNFVIPDPGSLPSIPENRNLTEYYNAVDPANMMVIFASMLYERRILVTSKKLSKLTACVHGSASLIYPMYWQHLYIPVLPTHLIDYCTAPMPYIIGIHSTLMAHVRKSELGDAVILDVDAGTLETSYDDLSTLPADIISSLKKRLKEQQTDKVRTNYVIGDMVARAFLKALVALIGGYRDALKFRPGEQISFDPEAFIQSRPPSMQGFLEKMLHLQTFQQFIDGRLDLLNAGIGFTDEFELEANMWADKHGASSKYKEWLGNVKKQGKKFRRDGKDKWTEIKSVVKHRYKDIRNKIEELGKEDEEEEGSPKVHRHRPKTIPNQALRRERPPRPPPPNLQGRQTVASPEAPVAANRQSLHHRRTSYEKRVLQMLPTSRSRHYKMISFHADGSQDDSDLVDYKRVSIDLMGDPDIQQIMKKSYSSNDILQDQLEEYSQEYGSEEEFSQVTLTTKVPLANQGKAPDRLINRRPVPAQRKKVERPSAVYYDKTNNNVEVAVEAERAKSIRMGAEDESSRPRPIPPPRKKVPSKSQLDSRHETTMDGIPASEIDDREMKASENLLIDFDSSSGVVGGAAVSLDSIVFDPLAVGSNNAGTSTETKHEQNEQNQDMVSMPPVPKGVSVNVQFFEALNAQLAASEATPSSSGEGNAALDSPSGSGPSPRPRSSLIRSDAFSMRSRPESFSKKQRPLTVHRDISNHARTNFFQGTPVAPVFNQSVNPFNPLSNGNIAVDNAFPSPYPAASGGPQPSPNTNPFLADCANQNLQQHESSLLKEWSLDFGKLSVAGNSSPSSQKSSSPFGSSQGTPTGGAFAGGSGGSKPGPFAGPISTTTTTTFSQNNPFYAAAGFSGQTQGDGFSMGAFSAPTGAFATTPTSSGFSPLTSAPMFPSSSGPTLSQLRNPSPEPQRLSPILRPQSSDSKPLDDPFADLVDMTSSKQTPVTSQAQSTWEKFD